MSADERVAFQELLGRRSVIILHTKTVETIKCQFPDHLWVNEIKGTGREVVAKPCREMQLILIPLAGFEHSRVTGTNQGHQ